METANTSNMYMTLYPEMRQPKGNLFKLLDENLDEVDWLAKPRQKYEDIMNHEIKENMVNKLKLTVEYYIMISPKIINSTPLVIKVGIS